MNEIVPISICAVVKTIVMLLHTHCYCQEDALSASDRPAVRTPASKITTATTSTTRFSIATTTARKNQGLQ
jgi:hypothetical protein